jgi:dolichol kinase
VTREDGRQFLHFAITLCALSLIWLPLWAGWAACAAAILVQWVVLPLLGVRMGLEREGERWISGLKMYPIAVLVVLVAFRHELATAVAAWGVMGVGDAASNLVGRNFGTPGFLGRQDRSWLGSLAFFVTAWPAAWALACVVGGMPMDDAWRPALVAAVAGTLAELLPLQRWIDDNFPIALAAALAFHFAR